MATWKVPPINANQARKFATFGITVIPNEIVLPSGWKLNKTGHVVEIRDPNNEQRIIIFGDEYLFDSDANDERKHAETVHPIMTNQPQLDNSKLTVEYRVSKSSIKDLADWQKSSSGNSKDAAIGPEHALYHLLISRDAIKCFESHNMSGRVVFEL